jgi:hypothetical protein
MTRTANAQSTSSRDNAEDSAPSAAKFARI